MRDLAVKRSLLFLALAFAYACSDSTGPGPDPDGLDLGLLFAPPTTAEITSILTEWSGRNTAPMEVQELAQTVLPYGARGLEARVVSHRVGGVEHMGAIFTPVGAPQASLPVLVYCHGGDQGENLDLTLLLLPMVLEEDIDEFVFVVPSFRSESLLFDGVLYTSGGEPSPWDRDVDDALSLLEVTLATTPAADPGRVGALGFSRGGNVALLMAIRDPRIDAVVEYFGPTDFFGPFVREVVEEALEGEVRDLPGLAFLNQAFIQPLKTGAVTPAQVRSELLRRSPVYFADRLPDVQVHHGTADTVVPVGEGERLIEVMTGLGRSAPGFEGFIYEGGTHSPLALPGSLPRTREFLHRLTGSSPAPPPTPR